jgi:hypothetical protein
MFAVIALRLNAGMIESRNELQYKKINFYFIIFDVDIELGDIC